MTLVDHSTGEIVEIVERPTYGEVRNSIAAARQAGAKFFEQIVWQVERRAWEVLGYSDWDAMREAEYADMGVVVPRADRPEIVTRLRKVGLTQREVAETIGVSEATVRSDLNRSSAVDLPPVIETPRGPRPATYTPRSPETFPQVSADVQPTCERPELERQATDFLSGEQAIQDGKYVAALLKAARDAMAVTSFDADRVARIADDVDLLALNTLANSIADWHRRLTSAGNSGGLRVISGGIQ